MINIWHVGAWGSNRNFGDEVLRVSITDTIKNVYAKPVNFTYVNCQTTYFSPQLISYLNKSADLFYIGGGGLLFHRPQDNSKSGWQFNIDLKNLDLIDVPIVVDGIGYNKFPYDEHNFEQKMWDSVSKLVDKSLLFSVRNCGTLNVLKDNITNYHKIDIVPDAGMFIKSEPFVHEIFNNDKLKIGLNWASDRSEQRFFGAQWEEKYVITLNTLKQFAQENNALVYIIEHLLPNELNQHNKNKIKNWAKLILKDKVIIISEALKEELYPPAQYYAGFFADLYRQMDIVLGMRGHATIIPFGQKTPFLGLGKHRKVEWFMKDVGLEDFVVPLDNDKDDTLLKEKLYHLKNNLSEQRKILEDKLNEQSIIRQSFMNKVNYILWNL
ncbi:MAG TPA: polysaccharide pyruvyl transferase family protein [Nitrososphaeraceae archaeon]|nr:polysaccharide pyruvyl transferase family protein [Nitrososphaeraceae archaeon]